jgi:two-component system response regulator MprA
MPASETTPQRVLIVDDDARLRSCLAEELGLEGYTVVQAGDGQAALGEARHGGVDLVVLDWTLPDFSGVEVCRRLRATGVSTPVLMLSGRDEVRDRVEALDSGADDYLVKPFSIEELLARLRALQRRAGGEGPSGAADPVLELADLRVDTASREVQRGGAPVHLSVREYDLLLCLLRRANAVVTRQQILDEAWGENFFGDTNVLDVYIRYLRQKLEQPGLPTLVQTVRGVGFMLKPGPSKV